ncbi:DUF4231 domain-containing protein [Streptomyces griseorubiginosus]|uniref:DUF4231 domain-containing protein n=1 Tax=Streptomyces griseorubiginosus TaxID=67304 RepID=UPI0036AFFA8F
MAATTPGQNVPGPRATIGNDDLPPLFRSNDQWALTRQREAFRATMTQLTLLLVTTVFATLADHFDSHTLTALSALLYGLTVVTGVVIQRRRARAHWQAHRDAAETVKSLAWQYMVHGGPFHSKVRDPDGLFNQQLEEHYGIGRQKSSRVDVAQTPGSAPCERRLWEPASRHERGDPRQPQITRVGEAAEDSSARVRSAGRVEAGTLVTVPGLPRTDACAGLVHGAHAGRPGRHGGGVRACCPGVCGGQNLRSDVGGVRGPGGRRGVRPANR